MKKTYEYTRFSPNCSPNTGFWRWSVIQSDVSAQRDNFLQGAYPHSGIQIAHKTVYFCCMCMDEPDSSNLLLEWRDRFLVNRLINHLLAIKHEIKTERNIQTVQMAGTTGQKLTYVDLEIRINQLQSCSNWALTSSERLNLGNELKSIWSAVTSKRKPTRISSPGKFNNRPSYYSSLSPSNLMARLRLRTILVALGQMLRKAKRA